MTDIVTINGVDYAPIANRPKGNRAVVVVDRGWIFAGDVTREPMGLIRAVTGDDYPARKEFASAALKEVDHD